MRDDDLNTVYQEVTGLSVSVVDDLPKALCWECCYRLLKCHRFRNQALLTHSLLESLLDNEGSITKQNIRKINRFKNGLQSKLTQCVNTGYYFDVKILKEEISENEINQNSSSVPSADQSEIEKEFSDNQAEIKKEFIDVGKEIEIEKEFSDDQAEVKMEFIDVEKQIDNNDSHNENDSHDSTIDKKNIVKKKVVAKSRTKPKGKSPITKLFTITDLTYEEQVQEIEKRKLTDNYTQSEFKCDKCYKGFSYESTLKFHMTRHTDESGKFECAVCKLHFKTSRDLERHVTLHWQKFQCTQCPYVTSTVGQARSHEAFHSGAQYTCSHCSEVFTKPTTYMSHLRIKHPSDIVCEQCGNSFVSQKGLYMHKNRKHRFDEAVTPDEKHRCEQCDLSFVKKEALQTHLRAKHNVRTATDPAADPRNMMSWIKRCKVKEPMQCELCDASLPDPRAYYNHFRRAHPDKNRTSFPSLLRKGNIRGVCEVCGQIFTCRAKLEDHSNTHSAGVRFKCPQCDKVFLTRYSLARHSRSHIAPRTIYSCSVCEKNFSHRSNLRRHEFSHTGLKPHKCSQCGKSFRNTGELRTHFQYVHLKKPYPKRRNKQDVSETLASDCNERWPAEEKAEEE